MKAQIKSRSAKPLGRYVFQVDSLSHEGRGIALYQADLEHPEAAYGKKVFIQFALPGEQVRAQITHQSKRLDEADAIEILSQPSKDRVEPICQHFELCGGCNLQHMHADAQIAFKQQVLDSHLTHFAGVQPEQWLTAVRSQRTDYRCRARVGVRYVPKLGRLVFGFRARNSNRLVDIQECPVLDQTLGAQLPTLKKVLETLKAKADIGHIELAMGDAEIALLVRHTAELSQADRTKLLTFAQAQNWQLYLQSGRAETLKRIDQTDASPRLHYSLPDFKLNFAFSPLDFTQVNASVNAQMVALACELLALKQGERVLDLFCGLGNFSLPLARCVGETGQVIAVEGSEDMVLRGTENAVLNHLNNIQFFSQDLTQDFSQQPWAQQDFDALLIDPPRSGADAVMHYISHFGAKRIVYISCNPATLARDTGILVQQGYTLKRAGVMDMFTHTGHVESITLFEKTERINDANE
ncbi:23S rRNA (uracil(1939)-C(5))-methyltransferase RlmD [Acinetobacter sp. MD2(2019)]|uniref:23S rRNA (uracil(1939)-C(5))-methyltransferase RlmD n=1 Tax=Acinetobacter sp. MD2(2019) TaxID=2605273 RepID=UPI002D1ECE73|nr:23S rRNA (uracil(1939)-C(5))-methyltransferase RlmD [Acinetobacter sp. MD2(2019)]MEB3754946.1 23S rRNA (uracil(1939)-C(5))-methyltransferase RlmD [Acinetobacter sp. MD2(2019)]